MLPFQTLLPIQKSASTPVYQQIANGLIVLIRDGIIKPGAVLPGSRQMALLLQVHRKTVIAAYDELFTQDWITTIPRKGVIVSEHLPEIKPRSFKAAAPIPAYAGNTGFAFHPVSTVSVPIAQPGKHRLVINDGLPDIRLAPVELLLREYRRLFNSPASKHLNSLTQLAGSLPLRNELVQFLSTTRGLNITSDNILITRGAQMAIYLAARLILKPGAVVLVGASNYFLADLTFQSLGAKLVRIPVDEHGMDIDAIEKICKRKKPDLLYIIPHHHHPTTVTLSADRRMKLLELIRTYKFAVIEDDYDYDFHYSGGPILPLASADHGGNVIYIGSLTKSLSTAIRVGYMVAPENFIRAVVPLRVTVDIRGDALIEASLAELFAQGDIQRHLKKSVKLYHERRDMLCALLQKELGDLVSFQQPSGGMALWTKFHPDYPLPAIAARASAQGLFMSDGSTYSNSTHNENAMRFGFAGLNAKEMEEIVQILKQSIR
jgi:GntR family transcriptional regulator/MocR family aminotransferase